LVQFPSFSALQKKAGNVNIDTYNGLLNKCKRDWFYGINKNIQLHLFEDAGLLIWEDEPGDFDRRILQFIK
jgi:pimeloyl-ACP methyl ester carboxylesterase